MVTKSDKPELEFEPGELTPCWKSAYPDVDLSESAINTLKMLADSVAKKDVAARRWEVEQAWESRLFARGYQYLLPRRGGGWIMPPFATDYSRASSRHGALKWYGNETNIYTTYMEILIAVLTRDVPQVRFFPFDPEKAADITCAAAAKKYARIFSKQNDLKGFQQQLAYYLCTDGRAVIVTDYVVDAQRFGRDPIVSEVAPSPETAEPANPPIAYIIRHGQTQLNEEGKARGTTEAGITEAGKREMLRAVAWLKGKGVGRIITSPSTRSVESAQILGQGLGIPVDTDERLGPLDIGQMAGSDSSEVKAEIAEHFETGEPIGDGESPDDFKERVRAALFEDIGGGPIPILVVHDSVISCIFGIIEGTTDATSQVELGGIVSIDPEPDGTYSLSHVFPYRQPTLSSGARRGTPRGAEIVTVYGKLEAKVPINALDLADMPFVQISREYDHAYVKAMFPAKADQIKPGGSAASGENQLDRIARINAALSLEATYVTGDSMIRDCTVQRTWFRPGYFMEVSDKDVRGELFTKFPDGCHMIIAGDTFISARNECMEDHLGIVQSFPGSGQNRISLLGKLLSLQKRVNNWTDLLNDFYTRTVPQRYINNKMFDVEAIQDRVSRPGPYVPFNPDMLPPGKGLGDVGVWVEPSPTHQPSLPDLLRIFVSDWAQLLSGGLPSVFGAEANTDTVGGIAIQRDQALGRLGTPWHAIQTATANYFRQAVQIAAQCRTSDIRGSDTDGGLINIPLIDIKGRVLCYPEEDANFPESWNQKQTRYQMILLDASTNPYAAQLLMKPSNLKTARDMAGFQEFKVPEADSYDKQIGEFELLLATGPIPNIEKQDKLAALRVQAQAGVQISPDEFAQAGSLADFVSSVPVDEMDNHAIEYQACLDWINGPEGRKYKNGSQAERLGFQNIRLHAKEHKAAIAPPEPPTKPPSVSLPLGEMPPDAAAQALERAGIHTNPMSIVQGRLMEKALKKPS